MDGAPVLAAASARAAAGVVVNMGICLWKGVPRPLAQLGRMGPLTLPHTLVPECPRALLEPGATSAWVSRDCCVHNCLSVASSLPAADR